MKLDSDIKLMSLSQLRQEVMKLRRAIRQEVKQRGNGRCWITLAKVLPEKDEVKPLELSELVFLGNCKRYFRRNTK